MNHCSRTKKYLVFCLSGIVVLSLWALSEHTLLSKSLGCCVPQKNEHHLHIYQIPAWRNLLHLIWENHRKRIVSGLDFSNKTNQAIIEYTAHI